MESKNNNQQRNFKVKGKQVNKNNVWKNKTALQKAMDQFNQKKAEKKQQKQERQRKNQEKVEALARYRKQKQEKYSKLNKKTRKGQPVMKHRMEFLLEKIQKTCSSTDDISDK